MLPFSAILQALHRAPETMGPRSPTSHPREAPTPAPRLQADRGGTYYATVNALSTGRAGGGLAPATSRRVTASQVVKPDRFQEAGLRPPAGRASASVLVDDPNLARPSMQRRASTYRSTASSASGRPLAKLAAQRGTLRLGRGVNPGVAGRRPRDFACITAFFSTFEAGHQGGQPPARRLSEAPAWSLAPRKLRR